MNSYPIDWERLYLKKSETAQRYSKPRTTRSIIDSKMDKVRDFAAGFADRMELEHSELTAEVQRTGNLSGVAIEILRSALEQYKKEMLIPA